MKKIDTYITEKTILEREIPKLFLHNDDEKYIKDKFFEMLQKDKTIMVEFYLFADSYRRNSKPFKKFTRIHIQLMKEPIYEDIYDWFTNEAKDIEVNFQGVFEIYKKYINNRPPENQHTQNTPRSLEGINTIIVAYWVPGKYIEEKMGISHKTTYPYSLVKQNYIIKKALSNGFQVMLKGGTDNKLIIWIDNFSFKQR